MMRAHSDKISTEEPGSETADALKDRRPMSPGTLALMCDEQDPMFTTSKSDGASPSPSDSQSMTEAYAKQEMAVMLKFRDFLCNISNCARMKEEKCSLMATRSGTGTARHPETRVTEEKSSLAATRSETSRHPEAVANGPPGLKQVQQRPPVPYMQSL